MHLTKKLSKLPTVGQNTYIIKYKQSCMIVLPMLLNILNNIQNLGYICLTIIVLFFLPIMHEYANEEVKLKYIKNMYVSPVKRGLFDYVYIVEESVKQQTHLIKACRKL